MPEPEAVAGTKEAPGESTAWKRIHDVAKLQGTKFSNAATQAVIPTTLLGTYFAVWDDAWNPKPNADAANPSPQQLFEGIVGEFRWWRKIGSFRGLKRDNGASENLWRFDDVSWRELGEDEGGPDETQGDEHLKDGFGLAALVTLDDAGNPFLEMLFHTKEDRYGQYDFTRILWKKPKDTKRDRILEISWPEAKRLRKDNAVPLERNWDSDDEEETKETEGSEVSDVDADTRPGVKRRADLSDVEATLNENNGTTKKRRI
ncbi:unnamed protein product [Cyclocybe aegerita]|uniref:Uncharacterized protein n=1 Tax=Cyclocybe aegerita TaxID=1973307 RepID=A0A8S0W8A4_CYCAE|nr:unnamed protein product [Cyclocybe aegerita]